MNQDIVRPTIFGCLLDVLYTLICIFYLVQNNGIMRPRNLCRHRLHKCFIRISFREFCHVFEVAHGISLDIRERNTDIGGKILYEFTPPCLVFVYHLAYMVIAS